MDRAQPAGDLSTSDPRRRRWLLPTVGGDDAEIRVYLPGWWLTLRQLKAKLTGGDGRPSPGRNAPTFMWPAFSAARWAAAWGYAMVEIGPPHHTWKWLFLVPFCVHSFRAVRRLGIYLTNRVRMQAGLEPLLPDGSYPPLKQLA